MALYPDAIGVLFAAIVVSTAAIKPEHHAKRMCHRTMVLHSDATTLQPATTEWD